MTCTELMCCDQKDIELTRFAVALTMRYHSICILIDRPILLSLLDQEMLIRAKPHEIAVLKEGLSSIVGKCINSCTEMIEIVGVIVSASERNLNLNGAYWISAYFGGFQLLNSKQNRGTVS